MKELEISEAAIKRNVAWIEAVENALAAHGNMALTNEVIKAAGQKCARQILDDCRQILGKKGVELWKILASKHQL